MLLDIIIPQFKEGESEIRPLLESLDMQIGISKGDFQVTILNDCSEKKLSLDFLKHFNLNINYLQLSKNVGPGMTRQAGLDNTSAPWVMFCDADDCLYKADVLSTILTVLKNQLGAEPTWSFLSTTFLEENFQQGFQLIRHEGFNMIFMHGKVFNRSFLNKYNIRFKPGLRSFEDTYFCKTCSLAAADMTKTLTLDSYVWKRAAGSISSGWNHDGKSYLYWRVDDYISCNEGTLDLFRERFDTQPITRIPELAIHTLMYTYFILNSTDYENDGNELTNTKRQQLLDMCNRLLTNNRQFLLQVSEELVDSTYKTCEEQNKKLRSVSANTYKSYNYFIKDVLNIDDELYNIISTKEDKENKE